MSAGILVIEWLIGDGYMTWSEFREMKAPYDKTPRKELTYRYKVQNSPEKDAQKDDAAADAAGAQDAGEFERVHDRTESMEGEPKKKQARRTLCTLRADSCAEPCGNNR